MSERALQPKVRVRSTHPQYWFLRHSGHAQHNQPLLTCSHGSRVCLFLSRVTQRRADNDRAGKIPLPNSQCPTLKRFSGSFPFKFRFSTPSSSLGQAKFASTLCWLGARNLGPWRSRPRRSTVESGQHVQSKFLRYCMRYVCMCDSVRVHGGAADRAGQPLDVSIWYGLA